MTQWEAGGKQHVLATYARLHKGRIGQHWLWASIERIVAGDSEEETMRDFGYQRVSANNPAHNVELTGAARHERKTKP